MDESHANLIALLGGPAVVAKRLGIATPSVTDWVADGRDGIPRYRLIELACSIELATDMRVRRWHVIPDAWWLIWPELVGKRGAPRVAKDKRLQRPVPQRESMRERSRRKSTQTQQHA